LAVSHRTASTPLISALTGETVCVELLRLIWICDVREPHESVARKRRCRPQSRKSQANFSRMDEAILAPTPHLFVARSVLPLA
jgi:hypothetical protein